MCSRSEPKIHHGLDKNPDKFILKKKSQKESEGPFIVLVYLYIYGDHIPHLHVHLAPHTEGDIFVSDVTRSDVYWDSSLLNSDEANLLSK